MDGLLEIVRRLRAYALAVLAASGVFYLLSPLEPIVDGYGTHILDVIVRFEFALFVVAILGTPFAMIVLLILRLTNARGLASTVVGGAAVPLLAALVITLLDGFLPIPVSMLAMLVAAGAVGGAVYHRAIPRPKAAS